MQLASVQLTYPFVFGLYLNSHRHWMVKEIKVRIKHKRTSLLLGALATLLLTANIAWAQDAAPARRLRGSSTVKGFIGGEAHDSYVIRARQGKILSVQISWRRANDNNAQFTVSESLNFGEQVEFGTESDEGERWSGKIPKTKDYFIHVIAHPTAHYTLRIKLK
jgi:hypothetical protein